MIIFRLVGLENTPDIGNNNGMKQCVYNKSSNVLQNKSEERGMELTIIVATNG